MSEPTIANQNLCPQCRSAEFYWNSKQWLEICDDCGFEAAWEDCYPSNWRCSECLHVQYAEHPKQCTACGGTDLVKEVRLSPTIVAG